MRLNYYKNLDGVRAIAALMVMLFHFFREIEPDTKMVQILSTVSVFGQTGVTLFFVLSGFLITRILLQTKETEGYFKNFYVRRTLRIFPLYYLFLVLWYFVVPLVSETEPASLEEQMYYFTYLQDFARTFDWNVVGPHHFWSLAVEEHFYLFWPLVVYFVSRKNLIRIIVGIILFAALLRAFMLGDGYSVFIFTFTRFDTLAIGALLAILELKDSFRRENSRKFLMLLCGLSLLTLFIWVYFAGEGNDYIQNLRYVLLSFTYSAAIGFVLSLKDGHLINRVLRARFLLYTGKISYGLYVYHPLVYLICTKYIKTDYIASDFIVRFILSYIIAGLSYRFFESAFLRLKKYFEYSGSNKPQMPQSALGRNETN